MKLINEAYRVLGNASLRSSYDATHSTRPSAQPSQRPAGGHRGSQRVDGPQGVKTETYYGDDLFERISEYLGREREKERRAFYGSIYTPEDVINIMHVPYAHTRNDSVYKRFHPLSDGVCFNEWLALVSRFDIPREYVWDDLKKDPDRYRQLCYMLADFVNEFWCRKIGVPHDRAMKGFRELEATLAAWKNMGIDIEDLINSIHFSAVVRNAMCKLENSKYAKRIRDLLTDRFNWKYPNNVIPKIQY